MNKTFNIIIAGVGGQGVITLIQIINEAALIEGYDVKSSELHGLSQRGGSVIAHIKFGKKIFSPLAQKGRADLIIGLEELEGLRASVFASPETKFLINKNIIPFAGSLTEKEVQERLKNIARDNLYLIPASEICRKELGKEVLSGVYLLGSAIQKKIMPLRAESILKAIEKKMPEKYLEINKKAFIIAST